MKARTVELEDFKAGGLVEHKQAHVFEDGYVILMNYSNFGDKPEAKSFILRSDEFKTLAKAVTEIANE